AVTRTVSRVTVCVVVARPAVVAAVTGPRDRHGCTPRDPGIRRAAGDGGPTCVRVWWTRHAFSVRLACYRGRDPSGEFWRSARWPGRWQAGAGSEPGPEVL